MVALVDRVNKGALRLDAQKPGWHRVVNLDILDQGKSSKCVLGQNYGSYYKGLKALGIGHDSDAAEFAYVCLGLDAIEEYDRATMLWASEVRDRLARDRQASIRLGEPATNKVTVTKAQIEKAKAHIASVYEQRDAFVEDLTPAGCLMHVLMDLGINVKVED